MRVMVIMAEPVIYIDTHVYLPCLCNLSSTWRKFVRVMVIVAEPYIYIDTHLYSPCVYNLSSTWRKFVRVIFQACLHEN